MSNNPLLDNEEQEPMTANAEERLVTDDRTQGLNTVKQKGVSKQMGLLVMALGLLLLAFLIVPKIYNIFKSDDVAEQAQEQQAEKTSEVYRPYEPPKEPKTFTFDETEDTGEKLGEVAPREAPRTTKLNKSLGQMMVKSENSDSQSTEATKTVYNDLTNQAIAEAKDREYNMLNGQGSNGQDVLGGSNSEDIFSSPTFTARTARKSQFNPNLLLEQGTLIPCVLRVKVISNISGQMSCTIADNVYSANGNVLLIEKGSRVNGYYEGNNVNHGSSQLFVVWQEVRTMNNLVIPLDSGSTDELGANGLNGWVDNHFWERFSNAVMLSMILDGNNILISKMADTQTTNTENSRDAMQSVATTVLEQMGDIKPTIYKNQGDKVGIFVARDIDFSQVYQLKKTY